MSTISAQTFVIIVALLTGCALPPPVPPYSGISKHRNVATGISNLEQGYKEPPSNKDHTFHHDAKQYLEGIENDLKLIEKSSENARDRIEAVYDSILYGSDPFCYTGLAFLPAGAASNFKEPFRGYPEFPEFRLGLPDPSFIYDELSAWAYQRELLDFSVTAEDYIDDGNNYIENCARDYEMIRLKGTQFSEKLKLMRIKTEEDPLPF